MKSRALLTVLLVGGVELIVYAASGSEFHGPNWALFLGCAMIAVYVGLSD